MSDLDRTILSRTGWRLCCSVSGYRNQGGNIVVYSNPGCTLAFQTRDTISQDMSLNNPRYCKLRLSGTLPNKPGLCMFVTHNGQCLVQVELDSLYNCFRNGVVQIVEDDTDFAKLRIPSISKSVAIALESDQNSVYLCYWPLDQALSYARESFLEKHSDPIWNDRR